MRLTFLIVAVLAGCVSPPPNELPTPDAGPADVRVDDTNVSGDFGFDGGGATDVNTPDADASNTDVGIDADLDSGPIATCTDAVRNADETDVDCGGTCPPCQLGQTCSIAADCDGTACLDDVCATPRSCREIQEANLGAGDGEYVIDPDGSGPLPELTVHCDMTSDRGVGYTMLRIEDDTLGAGIQDPYRAACEAVGLELVVPRSRAHGLALLAYNNGETPNLVGIYPESATNDVGLHNWEGRCQGQPCRFYLTDKRDNDANCGSITDTYEPSGDSTDDGALASWGPPLGRCPIGQFNDQGNWINETGYVLCSTNDAGPPTYESCLEISNADSLQATDIYGTHGNYTIQPQGASDPIEVYCDFTRDDGGYTYSKRDGAAVTAAEAQMQCARDGMQLFVPRTPTHLNNAFFVGLDNRIGPSGADDYLRFLGIYPEVAGASCANTRMRSDNVDCAFEAIDQERFFVHERSDLPEPDGSDLQTGESPVYVWGNAGNGTTDLLELFEAVDLPTTERFICHTGDKVP